MLISPQWFLSRYKPVSDLQVHRSIVHHTYSGRQDLHITCQKDDGTNKQYHVRLYRAGVTVLFPWRPPSCSWQLLARHRECQMATFLHSCRVGCKEIHVLAHELLVDSAYLFVRDFVKPLWQLANFTGLHEPQAQPMFRFRFISYLACYIRLSPGYPNVSPDIQFLPETNKASHSSGCLQVENWASCNGSVRGWLRTR